MDVRELVLATPAWNGAEYLPPEATTCAMEYVLDDTGYKALIAALDRVRGVTMLEFLAALARWCVARQAGGGEAR